MICILNYNIFNFFSKMNKIFPKNYIQIILIDAINKVFSTYYFSDRNN